MSHARASSKPPPIAKPLTAAMIGFVIRCCPLVIPPPIPLAAFFRASSMVACSHFGMNVFRSAPEQKAFPAPVTMAASTESSALKSAHTSHNASFNSSSRAFSASGRFSVTYPIRSRFS